ncbi:hypothetical protein M9H77_20260 [Catharanthus roseus]|uniref:Uncharacterized protein n=1 Tax=Catharanthus roseus TaxID=4058 RepID=A0ACC0AKH7_CATRO|nr:hypothetical protein M9H77_20260 [Catharanthus roseus]
MEIQGKNPEQVALLSIMREVEAVSHTVLRSILSFVFGTEEKSLLSKLIPSKQTGNQGEVMEKMDRAFEALKGQKTENIDFHAAESMIQELEEALECLFRQLLKSRISLLNMLTIS